MTVPARLRHAIAASLWLAGAVLAQAAAQAPGGLGPHVVHGSWVNVREAAAGTARVVDQLVTNTPVDVVARQGEWCHLRYSGKQGFAACALLGAQLLRLEETAGHPARAFWIAPSPNRLVAYGQSLPKPAALRLEALVETHRFGDPVRYPKVAEFEAAKQRLQAGVTLDPAREVVRNETLDPAQVFGRLRLRPAPLRPSLFRAQHSVALLSEVDADGLAAVAGSRVRLTPTGPPTGWFSRHSGPAIEGVTGFWDVGQARLAFDAPLTVYRLAANGLVAAEAVRSLPLKVGGAGHYCGAHFTGRSLDWTAQRHDPDFQSTPVRGHPALPEGTDVIAQFVLAEPLARKSVKIRTQAEVVVLPDSGSIESKAMRQGALPRASLREIDLDGDGVADLLLFERPLAYGEISVPIVYQRLWYVNVGGQWFAAGAWVDEDCT